MGRAEFHTEEQCLECLDTTAATVTKNVKLPDDTSFNVLANLWEEGRVTADEGGIKMWVKN